MQRRDDDEPLTCETLVRRPWMEQDSTHLQRTASKAMQHSGDGILETPQTRYQDNQITSKRALHAHHE